MIYDLQQVQQMPAIPCREQKTVRAKLFMSTAVVFHMLVSRCRNKTLPITPPRLCEERESTTRGDETIPPILVSRCPLHNVRDIVGPGRLCCNAKKLQHRKNSTTTTKQREKNMKKIYQENPALVVVAAAVAPVAPTANSPTDASDTLLLLFCCCRHRTRLERDAWSIGK